MCKEQERQGVTATRFARRKGGSQKPTLLILVDTLAPRRGMTADASTCNLVGVKNMILPQDDKEYERIFADAYDDAKRVCKDAGLAAA